MKGSIALPTCLASRGDAHAYGSACTYARRYSLAALIGICPHDDDGNAASGLEPTARFWGGRAKSAGSAPGEPGAPRGQDPKTHSKKPVSAAPAAPNIPQDPQGLLELCRLAAEANVSEAELCRHYSVTALDELSPRDAARVRRALAQRADAVRARAD